LTNNILYGTKVLAVLKEVTMNTAQRLSPRELQKRSDEREVNSLAHGFAYGRVKAHTEKPGLEIPDAETLLAAWFLYAGSDFHPTHQCYWNDRFVVAVACNLSWEAQQLAAWCAVSNGLNAYWEWKSHAGYNTAKLLSELGITGFDTSLKNPYNPLYFSLDSSTASTLSRLFDLPTTKFGHRESLDRYEVGMRDNFNARYPYHEVL
jgi:hypothetical protein